MVVTISPLFTIINDMLKDGKSISSISSKVASDPELKDISNSYCEQCGDCCSVESVGDECENKEVREDGLTYCMLHSVGTFPYDKQVPKLSQAVHNKLDSDVWAKPECCHGYGPLYTIFSWLEAKAENNPELIDVVTCVGGLKMLEEYKATVKESNL